MVNAVLKSEGGGGWWQGDGADAGVGRRAPAESCRGFTWDPPLAAEAPEIDLSSLHVELVDSCELS